MERFHRPNPPKEIRKLSPIVKMTERQRGVPIHLNRKKISMIHTENSAIQHKCIIHYDR